MTEHKDHSPKRCSDKICAMSVTLSRGFYLCNFNWSRMKVRGYLILGKSKTFIQRASGKDFLVFIFNFAASMLRNATRLSSLCNTVYAETTKKLLPNLHPVWAAWILVFAPTFLSSFFSGSWWLKGGIGPQKTPQNTKNGSHPSGSHRWDQLELSN